MSSFLLLLGRWCARHAKRVLLAWLVLLAVLGMGAGSVGIQLSNSFKISNSQALEGLDILKERLPQAAGTSEPVLITSKSGDIAAHQAAIAQFVENTSSIDGISMASDPFSELTRAITDDGSAALIQVQADSSVAAFSANGGGKPAQVKADLRKYADKLMATDPDLTVMLSGNIGAVAGVELSITEALGVLVAAVVLLFTFGSALAAGTPIISALIGVGVGMLGILVAAKFTEINAVTPVLAVMIGLAVGIDYALFIMSRAREYLAIGIAPPEAAGRAVATAGSAVVFAGMTVIIALCGLAVCRIPFLTVMGICAAFMVAVAVCVALTAIPAFLGLLGDHVTPRPRKKSARRARRRAKKQPVEPAAAEAQPAEQPDSAATPAAEPAAEPAADTQLAGSRLSRGWINTLMRAPWVFTIAVVALLGAAAIPLGGLSFSLTDNGYEPRGTEMRDTYDAIAAKFGEGYNSPIVVIADIVQSTDPLGLVNDLADDLEKMPGVQRIAMTTPNPDASLAFIQIIPEKGQADADTLELVHNIRAQAPALETKYQISNLMVTGITAVTVDVTNALNAALVPFGVVVVGLSLILLMIVIRSIAVPITATLGYVLSLITGLGAVGGIFGWGWFADLLKVTKIGPVISFLPVIVMGVLFGLAMDYEVFLVSRMREVWIHTGDARRAVREGFTGSAKVVTAAALIMTSVFAFFIPDGNKYIKPIAVALTVGIFTDAFLVRMTFIPAIMTILGKHAWWLPKFLDRLLPVADIEGEGLARTLEHSDWVRRNGDAEVRLEQVNMRDEAGLVLRDVSLVVRSGEFAYVRLDTLLSRTALSMLLAGRTTAHEGVAYVSGHVLPDGTPFIQASTHLLDYPDAALVPSAARLVVAVDPNIHGWDALAALADAGKTVLAILAPHTPLPTRYQERLRDAAAAAQQLVPAGALAADAPK